MAAAGRRHADGPALRPRNVHLESPPSDGDHPAGGVGWNRTRSGSRECRSCSPARLWTIPSREPDLWRSAGGPSSISCPVSAFPRRVLPRHQTEPGREVAAAPEALHRRRKRLERQRGDRPDARDRHQPRRLLALPRARPDLPDRPVGSFDLLVELVDPPGRQPSQLDDRLRQATVPRLENPGQMPDPGPALRSDHPVLGRVTPKSPGGPSIGLTRCGSGQRVQG